ncbi:MAG: DegT/DnrJ/EryC1/StrS family aminotransferase [Cyanobacteriota bacterium]|nr:DegT/DnrJ/EryC1/StrS family aminotransferase [Cyanobacteriota bacterium]
MTKIPPVDLSRQYAQIEEEATAAALAVLRSGYYIGGEAVQEFERRFGEWVGTQWSVGCNSGTDALYLALRAGGVGPGDEVITSAFTFFATAETISIAGAKPIFIDIDPQTFNLDLDLLESAVTSRTKAIMPVHLFGQSVDMTRLMAVARKYDLLVIEDCAQATGAQWDGRYVGAWGDMGAFSFFPTKNLGGCGDGGAVTLNDESQTQTLRMLREHGSRQRYCHETLGLNSRLDALQAAILSVKLRYLTDWNRQRREAAHCYRVLLQDVPDLILPKETPGGLHVWNQYTIRIPDGADRRDRVREILRDKGVIAMVYYPLPLHRQPVYESLGYGEGSLPKTERVCQEVLSLPIFPGITEGEQEQVALALKAALKF